MGLLNIYDRIMDASRAKQVEGILGSAATTSPQGPMQPTGLLGGQINPLVAATRIQEVGGNTYDPIAQRVMQQQQQATQAQYQAMLQQARQNQPTNTQRNFSYAGYEQGTPEAQSAMRDYLAKSPGATVNNYMGGQQAIRALTPEEQETVNTGNPYVDSKGNVKVAPDLPQVQRVNAGYADRMVRTGAIMDNINYDMSASVGGRAGWLPRDFQPGLFQQIEQAQNDWIRAKLRKESGAVIAPEEMEDERTTYFPQPGDSKKTVQQKKVYRDAATKAMIQEAGKAYQLEPPPGFVPKQ